MTLLRDDRDADYQAFLDAKVCVAQSFGFDVPESAVNPLLKPHQNAIVRWMVKGGRRACFAAFGLGKSVIQLEAVRLVLERVGGRGLIVLPLGVRQEFIRDAAMLGIPVRFIRRIEEADETGIYLTNYETVRDGKLDPRLFTVASLDEATVLIGLGGTKTFREFMKLFAGDDRSGQQLPSVPYRFVATATPSPNEYIELLAYSAYLGILDVSQAKTRFFKRDSTKADHLTLHAHKAQEFWLGTIYMTPFSSLPHRVSSFVLGAWLLSSLASAGTPARHPLYGPARLECAASSCGQLLVGDATADDASDERVQPLERVALHVAGVQAERELVHVTAGVLRADVVVDAVDAALQDRPHGLDTVGMGVAPDVLLRGVVDRLVTVEQPVQFGVGGRVVSEQIGADLYGSVDDTLDGVRGAVGDRHGDGTPAALTEPQDAHLAAPAARVLEPLPLVLVGFLAADERLVDLDITAQLAATGQWIGAARLTKPRQHEPGRFLGDADLLRQLKRRDPLARGDEQVHGVDPLVQRDVRPLEDGPGTDGEVQRARVATVVAARARRDALARLALGANGAVRPETAFEVDAGGFGVGEALEELERADGDVVVHLAGLPESVISDARIPDVLAVRLDDGDAPSIAPEIHSGLGLPRRVFNAHQALSGDTQALVAFDAWAENQQNVTIDAPHFENCRVEAHRLPLELVAAARPRAAGAFTDGAAYAEGVAGVLAMPARTAEARLQRTLAENATAKDEWRASGCDPAKGQRVSGGRAYLRPIGWRLDRAARRGLGGGLDIEGVRRARKAGRSMPVRAALGIVLKRFDLYGGIGFRCGTDRTKIVRVGAQFLGLLLPREQDHVDGAGNGFASVVPADHPGMEALAEPFDSNAGPNTGGLNLVDPEEARLGLNYLFHTPNIHYSLTGVKYIIPFTTCPPCRAAAARIRYERGEARRTAKTPAILGAMLADLKTPSRCPHRFAYLGMKTIVTDVVRENNQTYRLGWTEQCKDGTKMGVGMPEYLLLFRKPPTDNSNSYADVPVLKTKKYWDGKHEAACLAAQAEDDEADCICSAPQGRWVNGGGYSRSRWQIDAHGFARSSGNRPLRAEDIQDLPHDTIFQAFKRYALEHVYDFEHHVRLGEALEARMRLPVTFMLLQPPSWSPDVWSDVARMLTLNTSQAQKGKEQHLCPMPLDIARRVIVQMSNKGDVVYDPFSGLATVPVVAVEQGRFGLGCELSKTYFLDGVAYARAKADEIDMPTLFDLPELAEPAAQPAVQEP